MKSPGKCVLLFLRAPERGRVKTRLAASLGDEAALALHRCFVLDTLEMLSRTGYDIAVCCHPPEKTEETGAWLGRRFPCQPQTGEHLGDKMAAAFSRAFSGGCRQVVLMGSDVPDLPGRIIHQAFAILEGQGAVLGPAEDGGYYLVGFQAPAFAPKVFEGVSWGTQEVLAQTLQRFGAEKTPVSLLEPWRDIDDIGDIQALLARHPKESSAAPRTIGYLRTIRIVPFSPLPSPAPMI